jgi:hypothetical protein
MTLFDLNRTAKLGNGSRITSRIDLEHAAERDEDRSHAGAWERGFVSQAVRLRAREVILDPFLSSRHTPCAVRHGARRVPAIWTKTFPAARLRRTANSRRMKSSSRLGAALALWFSAFVQVAAGSEPQIIRVYVPAKQTSKWFAPGTELRVMPAGEFESLVKKATAGSSRRKRPEAPRLIRARHQASVSSGVLTGQTELIIASDESGPVDYVLDAWSPAVLGATRSATAAVESSELPANPFASPGRTFPASLTVMRDTVLGARDSGKTSIWVDRHPLQAVHVDWTLEPQKKARGRSFKLALPGEETTILSLEVPKDWIPSVRLGRRRGPLEAQRADQNLWEVEAESGRIELELYDPDLPGESPAGPGLWVSGATQIDLRGSLDRSGGFVNWSTNWLVELDPRNPTPLEIELDPGLELINVVGPAVRGYRILPSHGGRRVVVTAGGEFKRATEVRFLAHTRVPGEGPWPVPAIRPLNASWTGGTTTVVLDPIHIVAECTEKAGRRAFGLGGESPRLNQLVFQAESPLSVAELVFRKPKNESSCFVRGQLFVSGTPCRLECQLDWATEQALPSELEIELSPGWITDRVLIRGLEDTLSWHPSPLPTGSTSLRVAIPGSALPRKEISLVVSATSTSSGARGSLELPRARPIGARIVDEAWLAWSDERTMVRPVQARGLVWIDPGQVPGLLVARGATSSLRESLAWRWTAETAAAAARVDREPIEQDPSASIRTLATLDPAKQRLTLDGTLTIVAGTNALAAIPIWIESPAGSAGSLVWDDPSGGRLLPPHVVDQPSRAAFGLPEEGQALLLSAKIGSLAEKSIHFHAEYPWASAGVVPIVAVSRKFLQQGTIVVKTPADVRSRFKASRLSVLDASSGKLAKRDPARDAESPAQGDHDGSIRMDVHAFAFNEPGARLEVSSEPLEPVRASGVVREAVLSTSIDPGWSALNRLRLLVHCGEAQSLDLVLPAGTSLARVRRDGAEVTPIDTGAGLKIPLPSSSQGSRLYTIVLDYVTNGDGRARSGRMRAVLPAISFPCLSFGWDLIAPSEFKAVDCGPGLIAAPGDEPELWPGAGFRLWKRAWEYARGGSPRDHAEVYQALDTRLDESAGVELTFAEWFTRWDSGPRPLLVDRVALNREGFGPKSVFISSRAPQERRSVSLETLKQHGLGLAIFPNALVITTASQAPRFDEHVRWSSAIAEALVWGADRGDRLQGLARWRGESSPRLTALVGEDPGEHIKLMDGWSTWRFAAPGWPGNDAYLYLIDGTPRFVSGWLIAAVLALGWVFCRRWLAQVRWRFLGLILFMIASVSLEWLLPARYANYAGGVFAGGLLILIVELGIEVGKLPTSRPRTESSLVRRAARVALATTLLGVLLLRGASGQQPVQPAAGSAILALFPYEGQFDASRPATSVILRLADFERLSRMAEEVAVATLPSLRAVSAVHHIRRRIGRTIVVDTELEIVASGKMPHAWRVPVSGARDIEARLDGKEVPVAIAPGGERGEITIPATGSHALLIRRSYTTRNDAGFDSLVFPVNALASARVVVDRPEEGEQAPVLSAIGGTQLQADRTVAGLLGPAAQIGLRWHEGGERKALATVEGLILWDITPAGDRIRTRLTYQSPNELASLRLLHPGGLILRSARVRRSDGFVWSEKTGKDEWTLHVDPPLEPGETIELDCWMPLEASRAPAAKPGAKAGEASALLRELAGVQPIGVERYNGALGVRRPGDWTGRLDFIMGSDSISDESFVKSWGGLPDEPLTLCGTRRFVRESRARLSTGETQPRLMVKPTVELRLEPGRAVMTVEAELAEPSGRIGRVEAHIPEGMRIIKVAADGLADWSTTADGRLHLMFDGSTAAPRRRVQLMAAVAVSEDPLRIGLSQHRIRIPWIDWVGMEALAGFLVISSSIKPEIQGSTGMTPISSESSGGAGTTSPRSRLTFRVDDPRQLGEMSWAPLPGRVSVLVDSQVTIHPDSAEWIAVLRYDVVGGALDSIHLRMPASWSSAAQLHFSGGGHQLTTETRGQMALWTITPQRPVWGSQRLVLRSNRALQSDRELEYPLISPLGKGAVDAALAVVNSSGRPAAIETTFGLERIDHSLRFRAREFAPEIGVVLGAFRVVEELPILKVQLPRESAGAVDSRDESARLGFADVCVLVMPDRSVMGRATYDPLPGSGSFLTFELPAESKLLWATRDSSPVRPLRRRSGVWSIALEDSRQPRISVIWQSSPGEGRSPESDQSVGIPRAGDGMASTLITVHVPAQFTLKSDLVGLRPTSISRLEMARADWLARNIDDILPKIDRGSHRDHQKLVTMLIGHEMHLKSAQRSEEVGLPAVRADNEQVAGAPGWHQAARAARSDAVRRAGLTQDLAIANRYFGDQTAKLTGPSVAVPEPIAPERIRTFGRPFSFLGVLPGIDDSTSRPSMVLENRPWTESVTGPAGETNIALVVLLLVGLLTVFWRRGIPAFTMALFMTIGLAGYMGGPLSLAGALALAAAAWKKARRGGLA